MFGRPITLRLMENRAIIVRIDASRLRIPKRTFRKAVTSPQAAPQAAAITSEVHGSTPALIATAAVAAPSGNEPSTVKSGKSSTRKARKTPRATNPKIRPNSTAPQKAIADIGCQCSEVTGAAACWVARSWSGKQAENAGMRGKVREKRRSTEGERLKQLFNDLAGALQHRGGQFHALRFRRLLVDDEIRAACEGYGYFSGILAFQNPQHHFGRLQADLVIVEADRGKRATADGIRIA